MTKIVCLFFFSVLTASLFGQSSIDSSAAASWVHQKYVAQRSTELPLYSGLRHQLYSPSIEGLPYFQSLDWYTGSVVYDDVLYENIIMRFDQVKEELIIAQNRTAGVYITLFSPRVKEFSFAGAKFIRLQNDTSGKSSLKTGFYQVLAAGKVTALMRNVKEIQEKLEGTNLFQVVREQKRYYVWRDGTYYSVRKMDDLLDVVKDKRREVQQFASKNQLKYRSDPKQTLTAVTEFYNQL